MDVHGTSPYFGAHEIEPGKLYLGSRGEELYLVMGVSPHFPGDATGIMIIDRMNSTSFTLDMIVITGESFAQSSRFRLLPNVIVYPDPSLRNYRSTLHNIPEVGGLYVSDNLVGVVAMDRTGQKIVVNVKDGTMDSYAMGRWFWTPSWSILQKDINDEWISIYKR